MSGCNIGVDVISEILSHSSLKTVGKCRLLSKECNSLTYDGNFTELHCQRTKTIRGFFIESYVKYKYCYKFVSIEDPNSNKLSLNFMPAPVMILAACNKQGLLLCKSTSYEHRRIPRFYICKPTTKEWEWIPNPKTRYSTETTAMMVLGLKYKILRLSKPSAFRNLNRKLFDYHILQCEIFDSENWEWKQLEEIYLPRDELFIYKPAISVCGVFHWLTSKNNIFAFNVHDETWRMLPPPEELADIDLDLQMVEYEGKLGIVHQGTTKYDCVELWVMEDYYGKRIWNKRYKMFTEPLERKGSDFIPHVEGICNSDIALMKEEFYQTTLVFYNFKRGSVVDAVELDNHLHPYGIFPFQSDFEPSKFMVGRMQKQSNGEAIKKTQSHIIDSFL